MSDEGERKPERRRKTEAGRRRRPLVVLKQWLRGAFLENGAIKFVSLVLAITLYILVNTGQDVEIPTEVPVAYTMPDDRVVVSDLVDHVTVRIRGSWRRTRRFDQRELGPIHVDLRGRKDGVFVFQPHQFHLPPGLELVEITPPSMELRFEPLASKSVPIKVETVGQPAAGFRVVGTEATPSSVVVKGARSYVDGIDEVRTVAVPVEGRKASFTETVPLSPPQKAQLTGEGKGRVVVKVELVEELSKLAVDDLKVAVRSDVPGHNLDGQFTVDPPTVTVILHGSQAAIDEAMKQPLFPYVTVAPDDPGGRKVPVMLQVPGVGVELEPTQVTITRHGN